MQRLLTGVISQGHAQGGKVEKIPKENSFWNRAFGRSFKPRPNALW
jgi:hypothetical protein